MTTISIPPWNTIAIDATISSVNAAIDAARASRKAHARELALRVLAGDRELPDNVEDLEGVLVELGELRIVAEYAELKAVIDASPASVATLYAGWISCQASLEKTQREYYAAASELQLPQHDHWDARAAEFQSLLDEALGALNAARGACSHELTRAGDAKVRCNRLLREHGHLFVVEDAE